MKSFVKEKFIFILFSIIICANIILPVNSLATSLTSISTDDTKIVENEDEVLKLEINSESAILIERETRKCII
jgi:hypothetical protein